MKFIFIGVFSFLLFFGVFFAGTVCVAQSPFCNPKAVFAVDDYVLSQKIGKKPMPEVKPEYEGGIMALKDSIQARISDLPEEENQTFLMNVSFIVNCKGQASGFELLSKHEGMQTMYSQRSLEALQGLSAKWLPAKSKGRFIDCYGVVILSFYQGKLLKVALK